MQAPPFRAGVVDWHSHPKGLVLHIMAGKGLLQERHGSKVEFKAGDTVYTEHEVEHWHGAAPDRFMLHLAISPYTTEKIRIGKNRLVTRIILPISTNNPKQDLVR